MLELHGCIQKGAADYIRFKEISSVSNAVDTTLRKKIHPFVLVAISARKYNDEVRVLLFLEKIDDVFNVHFASW